jgi:hypothetical protein
MMKTVASFFISFLLEGIRHETPDDAGTFMAGFEPLPDHPCQGGKSVGEERDSFKPQPLHILHIST